uniref:Reverse transcriptase domain-containing protein n=1 Tax=Trichobilharzia regenti TaxID=157069 RepID=A0AA85JA03_TRIRE|nr:unnamed protein product [Trichobilharzia regenti]
MLLNARSLLNKITSLRSLVYMERPTLILVTETWLTIDIPDTKLIIDNYNIHRNDRVDKRGGGCLIYASKSTNSNTFTNLTIDKLPESKWISIHTNENNILVGCIYRAPNSPITTDTVIGEILEVVPKLEFDYKLVCGDFNLPGVNWDTCTGPRTYEVILEAIDVGGWKQCVRLPTRHNNILDLILCHKIEPISIEVRDKLDNSDHNILYCTLPLQLTTKHTPKSSPVYYQYRDYRNADWEFLPMLLRSSDWGEYFTNNNLEVILNTFYKTISSVRDTIAPLKSALKTPTLFIDRKTRIKLRKLKRRFYLYKEFNALHLIHEIFKNLDERHKMKAQVEENKALEGTSKTQELCKILQKRMKKGEENNISHLEHEDIIYDDPQIISELLSEWFSNNTKAHPSPILDITCKNNYKLGEINFNIQNIASAVRTLKANSSCGIDDIPSVIYKNGGTDMIVLLLRIFNISLVTETYPETWKNTYILPKHKGGAKTSACNYRPINITPVISRIMEKVIKDQMSDYFLKHKLINLSQHGFLKKRSCVTCHIDFFNEVTYRRDRRELVIILYFDIRKAFDRVPHSLLVGRLCSLGIRNPLYNWIKSFLYDRNQTTKVGSMTSRPRPISSGVIQGSVLGPLLFIIYINSICECFSIGKPILYADDLKVTYTCTNTDIGPTMNSIHEELAKMDRWCDTWRLEFNVEKCGWLCIGCSNLDLNLAIQGHKIPRLKSVLDLGLKYSHNLSFSEHISNQVSKSRRLIGFLLRNFYRNESRILLYKVCVRPLLDYCSFIFSSTRIEDKLKVEGVQRYFTRKVLGTDNGTNYSTRCEILGLETLWLRSL